MNKMMKSVEETLEAIRKKRPIVHCITNIVTVNDCANILLAVGASPIMAHHPMEVAEVTQGANALVCNMGALDDFEAMCNAAKAAKEVGHPIVIDPVGVSGSTYRRERCLELIGLCHPTCIRGNYAEIKALMKEENQTAGVDAPELLEEIHLENEFVQQIKNYAKEKQTIVVASGKIDIVTDGTEVILVTAGHDMMRSITGSGCMATSILGAFLSIEENIRTVALACEFLGKCGERAAEKAIASGGGTMTFRTNFIDTIGATIGATSFVRKPCTLCNP